MKVGALGIKKKVRILTHLLMYKHKRITVGVGMGNPFVDNYKRINETWNFPFGRNYQSGGKKIWNQDTDTGVMNTSK